MQAHVSAGIDVAIGAQGRLGKRAEVAGCRLLDEERDLVCAWVVIHHHAKGVAKGRVR
jgi:hypothetical protein